MLEGPQVKEGVHDEAASQPTAASPALYLSQPLKARVSTSRCSKFKLQKQLLNQATPY